MTIVTETLPRLVNLEKVVVRGEKLLTKALFAAIVLNRLTELSNMEPRDHLATAITLTGLFLLHSWTCHQDKELNANKLDEGRKREVF